MTVVFKNVAFSSLDVAVDGDDTSFVLPTGEGARFPSLGTDEWFPLVLRNATQFEIVHVTARSDDTLTVTRGAEGTTPASWAAGSRIDLRATAAVLAEFTQREAPIVLAHTTTPANPSSGRVKLYAKSDDKLYVLDATGEEKEIGSGGGGEITADDVSFDNSVVALPDDPATVQAALEKIIELSTAPSIGFRAFKGSNQTAPVSGSYIVVTCGSENWDEGSYYDTSTSRWTPPAGRYSCYGNALLTSGIEDGMLIAGALLKNGTMVAEYNGRAKGTGQQSVPLPPTEVEVDGDDYLEFAVVLGGAGDKTIFAGTGYTYWGGHKI